MVAYTAERVRDAERETAGQIAGLVNRQKRRAEVEGAAAAIAVEVQLREAGDAR